MIAKRMGSKSTAKRTYPRLLKSLFDARRVTDVWVRNCITEDLDLSVKEIHATQSLNQRVNTDKTYHLLLSFAESDRISRSQMREIEKIFCDSIGFGEHQRIAIVRNDTPNLRIHICINRIHPVKLTIHDPFQDMKRLQEVCIEVEKLFGLESIPRRNEKHEMKLAMKNRSEGCGHDFKAD
jgi:hypothetical protein